METKKYNWTYRYKNEIYEIIPDELEEKPKILYKLFSLNQYSFDSLINNYIYATHPSQFNDIFDCHEELLEFDDKRVIKTFLLYMMNEEEIDILLQKGLKNIKTFVQRNLREIIYRKLGIFSMTGNPNNILMWSYYTKHKGFCVEYDITDFPFKYFGPFPVNYQKQLEPVSIKKIGISLGVLMQSNLKFKGWEHENEWRLLIEAPTGEDMYSPNFELLRKLGGHNRKFYYPISAIKSIALGNRFFEPEEIIKLNSKELEINLSSNFGQKSIMLDFLAENKINTRIALISSLTEIKFRTCKVKRINYKIYKIKAI